MDGNAGKPVALVTGSSRGIGAAVAVEFAKAGYDIALNFLSSRKEALDIKARVEAEGSKAVAIQADVSSLQDIDRLFEELSDAFDRLDVMVNNAGITRFAPFLDVTPELFEQLVNTDFRSAFFCSQKAARIMIEKSIKGLIINITSNHQTGCWPIASVYASVKAAVSKLTQNQALELAPYGIRAISIAPGYTQTWKMEDAHPEKLSKVKTAERNIPLKRFCQPWEIGKACVFLAGEGASYITGTCIYMDGGALLPVVPENTFS
ncbi:MAG: SDR family oxidoreductase [Clostridiales bacterium]|jgi:NAD(P)-dependent dehydrogenase (short-subunit alcohol dehydrogenase family)|nr:SDR family oxidoreductase [Clostridiales bacterium]